MLGLAWPSWQRGLSHTFGVLFIGLCGGACRSMVLNRCVVAQLHSREIERSQLHGCFGLGVEVAGFGGSLLFGMRLRS